MKNFVLYVSKIEINKNKTQIYTTRSSPISNWPPVGVDPTLGTLARDELCNRKLKFCMGVGYANSNKL